MTLRVVPDEPRCVACGGTEDLMDRGMAPGMTYCVHCRQRMAQAVADTPTDWGYQAQQAAEAHMDTLERWQEYYDEGEPEDERPEGDPPESAGPYCGCHTCVIRETLHAAWPVIEEAVRSGDFD